MPDDGVTYAEVESMEIPVVGFVGRSGCGKTTLLERLIPRLDAAGVRVAVVKHSPVHGVQTDMPGTDTYRYWEAGVQQVTLAARDRVVHTHRYATEPDLKTALAGVHDVDLILLEGYKRSSVPKVEVIRRANDPDPIGELTERIAVVTDVAELDVACPRFGLDEVDELACFLMDHALKG